MGNRGTLTAIKGWIHTMPAKKLIPYTKYSCHGIGIRNWLGLAGGEEGSGSVVTHACNPSYSGGRDQKD
jgi:hypothetical protein